MKAIVNADLVMADHIIPQAVLFIEDGTITGYGEMRNTPVPDECERIDAGGLYLAPGMIDIHTHAGGGKFFQEDPVHVARHYLAHGTTTVLAALYFNLNKAEYLRAIDNLREAMGRPGCRNLAGIYLEGPYLNSKFGCDRERNPWKGPIRREDYGELIEKCGSAARVWAVAPERENILRFVKDVKLANPGAVFAVAHSEASPQQIEALIPYGLRIGAHHTNSTGDRVKYPECRGVCVDEAVNRNEEIFAELICDSRGIHVDPYMLRLIRQIKGDNRIILISDAFDFDGPVPAGDYEGADDINFDYEGEISGTKLTLEVACRNMMKHTGASIVDVFKYAAGNPAKALGLADRGRIAVGLRADLVIIDHRMNVKKVFIEGEAVS